MPTKPIVKTTTTATVTCQIELTVGSWGPECQLDQVYRQGSESAINRIRRMFGDQGVRVKVVRIEALTTNCEHRYD